MTVHVIRSLRARAIRAVRLVRTGTTKKVAGGSRIHPTVQLPRGSEVTAATHIGPHTVFAGPVPFRGAGGVAVGSWCAVGMNFTAIASNHSTSRPSMHFGVFDILGEPHPTEPADVRIGHGCWIGDNVTVLPGSVVGAGVVVGAGSVVRGEIPPYEVIAGVPARSIGSRCAPDTAAALERSQWWTWTPGEMRQRSAFFGLDISKAGPADIDAVAGLESLSTSQQVAPSPPVS